MTGEIASEDELAACRDALRQFRRGNIPDAKDFLLQLTISHLAKVPVTYRSLSRTLIGREVNRSFFRHHANSAVRDQSCALVRSWKSLVRLHAGPAAPRAAEVRQDGTRFTTHGKREAVVVESHDDDTQSYRCAPRPKRHKVGGDTNASSMFSTGSDGGLREPSPQPAQNNVHASLTHDFQQWTVLQLKAKLVEFGLSTVGCTEKSDLVELLRNASSIDSSSRMAAAAAGVTARLVQGRRGTLGSFGRRSLLRRKPLLEKSSERYALGQGARQKIEMDRILKAKDDASVLGFRPDVANLLPLGNPATTVLERYRTLCHIVHPDKCPEDLRHIATKAFQRLEAAKAAMMHPTQLSTMRQTRWGGW